MKYKLKKISGGYSVRDENDNLVLIGSVKGKFIKRAVELMNREESNRFELLEKHLKSFFADKKISNKEKRDALADIHEECENMFEELNKRRTK